MTVAVLGLVVVLVAMTLLWLLSLRLGDASIVDPFWGPVGGGAHWTFIGPMLITFLLLRVSGVTLLEKNLRVSKPGYAEYVERTSAFVPSPPRKGR